MTPPRRGVERLFDVLLRAYPPKLRDEHGPEIRDAFLRRLRAAARGDVEGAGRSGRSPASRAASRARQAKVLLDAVRSALWHGLAARLRPHGPRLSRRAIAGGRRRRRAGPVGMTGTLGQDLRLGLRTLRRSPAVSGAALGVIALAVGAATAIVAVYRGSLLAPFPYEDPDRIVFVWGSNPTIGQLRDVISGSNAVDFQRQAGSFEHLAIVDSGDLVVLEDGRGRLLSGISVTPELFDVLGVEAFLGRTFTAAEATSGGEPSLILSHRIWVERFGADPELVGRRVTTTEGPRTVVGVLPADFTFPKSSDIVLPLHKDVISQDDRTHYHYLVVGRMRAGVTAGQASAELNEVLDRVAREDPRMARWEVLVEPFVDTVTAAVRPVLEGLLTAAGMLLLIAGANVASVLLTRAADRRRENGVRRALGGGRWAIVRPMLAESWILVAAGTAAGWFLAQGLATLLPGLLPASVPIPGSAQRVQGLGMALDGGALLFCLGVGTSLGVLASLPAAVSAAGLGTPSTLTALGAGGQTSSTGSRGRRRLNDALVASELAVAVVLLAGATMAATTLYRLGNADPGLRPEGVITFYVGALDAVPQADRPLYYRRVLERVRQEPGVIAAALNDYVPFANEDDFEGLDIEGRPPLPPGEGIREEWRRVSTGYFEAVGIDRVAGRAFEQRDFEGGDSVAIVNLAFARKHFGDTSPLGKRILVHEGAVGSAEIVGVVGDVRRRGLAEPPPPVFYVPYHRATRPVMAMFVRTQGDPEALLPALQEAVWSVDPTQPVDGAALLTDLVEASIGVPRLTLGVTGALAASSLIVASLGVFALIGHAVRTRRREMGIRLALGASPRKVQSMMVRHGMLLGVIGLVAGLGLVHALAPALGTLVSDDSSLGPLTVIVPTGTLFSAALLAAWLPACRLRRLDLARTLRDD